MNAITVINGKRTYRMSEIMRQAWVIFRASKKSFAESLKESWTRAKSVMCDILRVEAEAIEKKSIFETYKKKISAASTEEEAEAILDEYLDEDIDGTYYGDLLSCAVSRL